MRETQQLDLFRRRIEDERELFGSSKLTTSELKLNKINERLYELAKKAASKQIKPELFQFPEQNDDEKPSEKNKALYKRFEEEPLIKTDQEQWEETQMERNAKTQEKKEKEEKNYQLLLSNPVEFVQQEIMAELKSTATKKEGEKTVKALTPDQQKKLEILDSRERLPIYPQKDELLKAIRDNQIIIIDGETGSGKTTQIPQFLHEIGYTKEGKIGITQPRRVAAMSVAARVAYEMSTVLGKEVGYTIRFEDCTSEKTIIKYMTDGMLLRELLGDPELSQYSVVMVDEAHERTLHTDILFGLIKDISLHRPKLKVLICSATLDVLKFSQYFNNAPRFHIPGRRHPVDIYYTKQPESDYIEATIVTILQIHIRQPEGDILLSLPAKKKLKLPWKCYNKELKGWEIKLVS